MRLGGEARSKHMKDEKCIQNVILKTWKEENKEDFGPDWEGGILNEQCVRIWLDSSNSGQGPVTDSCEYDNETWAL
jgi:hypothetical protein